MLISVLPSMIAVVLITTTKGGVPKMLAISISVLTRMMRAVLITRTMGGAKDIGDVDVSKNENDRVNTVNDDNRSDEDKNNDNALEPDKS